MYKKLCNALLVLLTLSLMVGCKEGSTQSKPFTLQKNKAKTVATKTTSETPTETPTKVLTIRVKKPDTPNSNVVTVPKHGIENPQSGKKIEPKTSNDLQQPTIQAAPEDKVNELKYKLGTQAMGKVKNPLEPSDQSFITEKTEQILPESQIIAKAGFDSLYTENPKGTLRPIPETEPIPIQPVSPPLYPGLGLNHTRTFTRTHSTNPSFTKNVNELIVNELIDKLKDELGKQAMDNEAFIQTVSKAMAKKTTRKTTYTLQQVVTMCEIQRAYFSDTDFADLTDVLTKKAVALLKELNNRLETFRGNNAADIVSYLGEKFKRDEVNKGYEETVANRLRDILQALDCLVAYNSENKSNIPKTDVDELRQKFNGIVGSTSSRQVLEYPPPGLIVRASQDLLGATAPPESGSNTEILKIIHEETESYSQEPVSILKTVSILNMMRDDLESKYGDITEGTKGMVDKIVRIVCHLNEHKEEKLEGLDNPKDTEAAEKTLEAVNKFLEKACTTLYDEDGEPTADAINACHNVVAREDFQKALKAAADTPTGLKNPLTKIEGDPSNRRLRKRLIALITGCVDKYLLKAELSGMEGEAILNVIQKFEKHAFFQFRLNGFKLNKGSKLNKKVELESDKDKVFVEVKKDEEPAGQHSRTETGTRVELV